MSFKIQQANPCFEIIAKLLVKIGVTINMKLFKWAELISFV